MTVVSSQEFNRQPTSVKRLADREPVFITERGAAAYVVLSIDEFRRMRGEQRDDLVSFLRSDRPDSYELPAVDDMDVKGAQF